MSGTTWITGQCRDGHHRRCPGPMQAAGCDCRCHKPECQWFLQCHEPATKQVEHPTIGWVDCCDTHIAWLGERPSPTQFVPPLAAKAARNHGLREGEHY